MLLLTYLIPKTLLMFKKLFVFLLIFVFPSTFILPIEKNVLMLDKLMILSSKLIFPFMIFAVARGDQSRRFSISTKKNDLDIFSSSKQRIQSNKMRKIIQVVIAIQKESPPKKYGFSMSKWIETTKIWTFINKFDIKWESGSIKQKK